jgi:hypothetical protein
MCISLRYSGYLTWMVLWWTSFDLADLDMPVMEITGGLDPLY